MASLLSEFTAKLAEIEAPGYQPVLDLGTDAETADSWSEAEWAGERAIELDRLASTIASIAWSPAVNGEACDLIVQCRAAILRIQCRYPELEVNF
jgi:hypothetical protein